MYHADRRRLGVYLTTSMIDPVMPLVAALLVKMIINAIVGGHHDRATTLAVLLGVIAPLPFVVKRVRNRAAFVMIDKSTALYDQELMRVATSVPHLSSTENPDYLDRMEQLRYRPASLGENGTMISVLLWGTLQAAVLVALLVSVHPFLLVLPIAALPGVWLARHTQHRYQRAFDAAAPRRRQASLFFEFAVAPARADEMRTLRAGPEILRQHRAAIAAADGPLDATARVNAMKMLAGRLIFVAGYIAASALVIRRGISGDATPGDVVLTVVLASTISLQMFTIIDAVSRLANALAMIDRYLWVIDYAANATASAKGNRDVPAKLTEGLRLRGLCFRYPNSTRDSLRDVDLDLPAGTVIAIVGDNGAGKTTLIKIITRMYEPTRGSLTVEATALGDIDIDAWRSVCTAAFQDYARVEASLDESIGIGDLSHRLDLDYITVALDKAGAADLPRQLPNGLGTPIGSSFDDGVQLSGGQWQKVALARTMMRAAPLLVILDEPSANLDPAAEADLFQRYAERARATARTHGTITLLVSHRFSTVRMADLIIVLDDGRVIETGTHHELIGRKGTYAELYELQAANYRS